jgi:EpsI family protein
MRSNFKFWAMVVLIVAAAAALHALSHGEPKLPDHPLSLIPMQLDGWNGTDERMQEGAVEMLGVTDWILRTYRAPDQAPVGIYVGFHSSQRTGSSIHSPKNCLPGAGWQPVENRTVQLHGPNGTLVPVNLYVIQKGNTKQLVLYWYQSHGRIIADEYAGKMYLVVDAIRLNRTDAAIARVVTTIYPDQPTSQKRAERFAETLMTQLNSAIPQ